MTPLAIETELRELIDRNLPADSAPLVSAFADRLFARDSADNRERVPAKRRLALVQSAFEFFAVRTEPVIARVETVTGDENDTLTIVETVTTDSPFIVDSLLEYFHHLGASVRTILHPVIKVTRDKEGRIATFERSVSTERGESFVHAELELIPTPDQAREIEREVISILTEVHEATSDFDAMISRALQICEETAARRDLIEVRDLLRWLINGGFVFLGYRRYLVSGEDGTAKFVLDPGTELGIMREDDESRFRSSVPLEELSPARRKLFFEGPPLVIGKTRAESHVHRRRPMDSVSIRRADAFGRVVAFENFVGLFTSKAYAEEAQHIPVLRAKLREVLAHEGAVPGSHDYKEIVSAFNSFPKDELFRAPVAELRAQLRLILDVKSEAAVRLFIAPDLRHGNVIALVVMPREAGSADLSRRIQDTLAAALHGTLVYFHLSLGEGYTARLHFCFFADPPKTSVIHSLESAIADLARRWDDRFTEQLIKKFGPKRGRLLADRWAGAFSADYQAAIDVARAVGDVEDVETLIASGRDFIVEAGPHASGAHDGGAHSDIRIVGLGDSPMLSDLMPTLQNFAIEVLSEDAHELHPRTDGKVTRAYLQIFSVQGPNHRPFAEFPGAALIADAIAAVRNGLAADDSLNALTLTAGLAWREVALLRAYLVAAFQMRLAPARLGLQRVLLLYPDLARSLFELFTARPLVRQSGHAGKNSGVARSVSRSSRLDRQYCRRSHRARAVVAGRGDRAHQFFLRDALARPVHRAQVRKRAHHKPARHCAALRNSRQQPAHGRMPSAPRAYRARRYSLQ